jgi:hypothetical protein
VPLDFIRDTSAVLQLDAGENSANFRTSREAFTIQTVASQISADNRVNRCIFKKINMMKPASML